MCLGDGLGTIWGRFGDDAGARGGGLGTIWGRWPAMLAPLHTLRAPPATTQQPMSHRTLRYCAYLIRLWEEGQPGVWRASAQHVQSGETVRFADVVHLFAFLQTQVTGTTPPEPPAPAGLTPVSGDPDDA